MGYSYDDRGRLCCDRCDRCGGVRRRYCPYTVRITSHRSETGERYEIRYGPAPALCDPCWTLVGKGLIHRDCAEGAARSQVREDAEQARLDRGDHQVTARWGDWHDLVPEGMVGACFGGRRWGVDERHVLLDTIYAKVEWLEDLPAGAAVVWEPHA